MLGYEVIILAFSCCSWLPPRLEMALMRPEAVSEAALQPMKGRRVAIQPGPQFSEAGMHDPADRIAGVLAAALADRYGLRFEPGGAPNAEALVLGVHTLEWTVQAELTDFAVRYRGEATLVDGRDGHRLGRAWCDRRAPTGKSSYDEALADKAGLAAALRAAGESCAQQMRESLLGT